MKLKLAFVLLLLLMIGCHTLPKPSPCDAATFLKQTSDSLDHFNDLNRLANATGRGALSPVVGEMLDVRRTYRELDAPDCAQTLQSDTVDGMNKYIEGYFAFMANEGDSTVHDWFDAGNKKFSQATKDVEEIYSAMGTPTAPAPAPSVTP